VTESVREQSTENKEVKKTVRLQGRLRGQDEHGSQQAESFIE